MAEENVTELDLTDPTVLAAVEKAAEERASNFDSERKKLLGHNEKLIEEKRKATAKAQELESVIESLGGEEGVKSLLKQSEVFQQTEEAELYKTDPNKWFEKKAENLIKKSEKHIGLLQQELDQEKGSGEKWKSKHDSLAIQVRINATQDNKGFTDDGRSVAAKLLATDFRALDDDGNPVMLDAAGEVVLGPDGMTPLTIEQRIEQMTDDYPSLFKKSSGGGAIGGKERNASGLPRGVKYKDDLTVEERLELLHSHPETYKKLKNRPLSGK